MDGLTNDRASRDAATVEPIEEPLMVRVAILSDLHLDEDPDVPSRSAVRGWGSVAMRPGADIVIGVSTASADYSAATAPDWHPRPAAFREAVLEFVVGSGRRGVVRYDMRLGGLKEIDRIARFWRPTHVISLCPCERAPVRLAADRHLRASMDDVERTDLPGAPTPEHAAMILAFGRALPDGARLLIHCEQGVSRSGAAALALLAQEVPIDDAVTALRRLRPQAHPNRLLLAYADTALGCDGKLLAHLAAIRQYADDHSAAQLGS